MLSAILILIFTFFIVFFIPDYAKRRQENLDEDDISKTPQMKKLWSLAQAAMRERKPLKAEKALLTILKFDEKNAAAYNRLGILYAREKHFKEAIECFEIAQSLDNNASSLHNVGLIYLETGKYEKAAMAFEQAIALEGDQPGRYIAYAKALEKLGQRKDAIKQLETAYDLNPTTVILRHMLEIYENAEDYENIEATKRRIEDLQTQRALILAKEEKAKAAKKQAAKTARAAAKTAKAEAKTARTKARADAKAARTAAKTAAKSAARSAKTINKTAAKSAKPTPKNAKTSSTNVTRPVVKPTPKLAKKRKII